jgi:hypothetical protein
VLGPEGRDPFDAATNFGVYRIEVLAGLVRVSMSAYALAKSVSTTMQNWLTNY